MTRAGWLQPLKRNNPNVDTEIVLNRNHRKVTKRKKHLQVVACPLGSSFFYVFHRFSFRETNGRRRTWCSWCLCYENSKRLVFFTCFIYFSSLSFLFTDETVDSFIFCPDCLKSECYLLSGLYIPVLYNSINRVLVKKNVPQDRSRSKKKE